MRKLALVSLVMLGVLVHAGAAPGKGQTVKAPLIAIEGSGVTGFVFLTALPGGGTRLEVMARGLESGRRYAAFYHPGSAGRGPTDLLDTFTAGSDGDADVAGAIEEELEDVGSVVVRFGPEYETLLACASLR